MKTFISVLVGFLLAISTLFVYWSGGGEFVRGAHLGKVVALTLTLFASGCIITAIFLPENADSQAENLDGRL